jgi:hypothetical protein
MALSAKERKRRQLERERDERRKMEDSCSPYLETPFFEFVNDHPDWSNAQFLLEVIGLQPPSFSDDSGPHDHVNESLAFDEETTDHSFEGFTRTSVGRAEAIAGFLIACGTMLARLVNEYKREELERRLQMIQAQDVSDPKARAKLFEEAIHIGKLLEELKKNTRQDVPMYQLKGL